MHLVGNSGIWIIAMIKVRGGRVDESNKTHPRSGPTSLLPVVSTLDAAHPDT